MLIFQQDIEDKPNIWTILWAGSQDMQSMQPTAQIGDFDFGGVMSSMSLS